MVAKFIVVVGLALGVAAVSQGAQPVQSLEQGFAQPPHSATPLTWWHWMNGNITREGISADLEAMKQAGLGGAQIFSVDGGIPVGPVKFMSPEWLGLVHHAAKEAARLGLELDIHNCPGWSSSGGPWNTPEHGMQEVVTSEVKVKGPARFAGVLPQPPTQLGFYRDIAVVAFPTPAGESVAMKDFSPKLTFGPADALAAATAKTKSPKPSAKGKSEFYAQFEFALPFEARMLSVNLGMGAQGGPGRLEVSDDGQKFRAVRSFWCAGGGRKESRMVCTFPTARGKVYRVWFTGVNLKTFAKLTGEDIELSPRLGVDNFLSKAFYVRGDCRPTDDTINFTPADVVARDKVVDLTSKLGGDGKLAWDAPAGEWTILRVGYTPNGVTNHPTPEGGEGLECDKLSAEAVDAHWAGMVGKVIQEVGPLAGTTMRTVVVDSYEVGTQNWTPKFRDEFRKRRGYDVLAFLPVLSGRVVESPKVTDRFLWDFRRTIADLFNENYAGRLAELAHKNNMLLAVEPYGNSPSDDIEYAAPPCDIPMSEFWMDKVDQCNKLAASTAHTNGQRVVAAESFTAGEKGGNKWETDFFDLKGVGDFAYCNGVNRLVFHTYTHQPWLDRKPGMTMGACGTHFDRTNTWWTQSSAWIDYLKRCQWMLQQGLFVADVCYYTGEDVPTSMYGGNLRVAGLPDGYEFDGCSAKTLLERMSVKDGRIVLPDGMSYRVLVLAKQDKMRPEVLKKIRELAQAGATVIGTLPAEAPGLTDYPRCDTQVKELAKELGGKSDKGGTVVNRRLEQVFDGMFLRPDFEYEGKTNELAFIHRVAGGADIYFVANRQKTPCEVKCTFRVSGKRPELWWPDSGRIEPAAVYEPLAGGRTRVPLRLDPSGSVFVVFRQADAGDPVVAVQGRPIDQQRELRKEGAAAFWPTFDLAVTAAGKVEVTAREPVALELKTAAGKSAQAKVDRVAASIELAGPWAVKFPPNLGAPASATFEKLISWPDSADAGVKYFSGTATYEKTFDVPAELLGPGKAIFLDLGTVKNVAQVKLNGQELGTLWKPPFRLDISAAARPGANQLEVRVTNLWPNRMIGDEQLPADCRWIGTRLGGWPEWLTQGKPSPAGRYTFSTRHHWTKGDALLPSGLIGPVQLLPAVKVTMP